MPVTTRVGEAADDEGPRAAEIADRAAHEQEDRGADGADEHERLETRALPDRRLDGRERWAPDLGIEAGGEQRARPGHERRSRRPVLDDVGEELGQRQARHTARCYRPPSPPGASRATGPATGPSAGAAAS